MISICRAKQAAASSGSVLQSATMLDNSGDWQHSSRTPIIVEDQKIVAILPNGSRGFFRLHKP
jgi:hypothetical protein